MVHLDVSPKLGLTDQRTKGLTVQNSFHPWVKDECPIKCIWDTSWIQFANFEISTTSIPIWDHWKSTLRCHFMCFGSNHQPVMEHFAAQRSPKRQEVVEAERGGRSQWAPGASRGAMGRFRNSDRGIFQCHFYWDCNHHWLVVNGCHEFCIFPEILGCDHHPNWRTPIFQRGGPTTNHQDCEQLIIFQGVFIHNGWDGHKKWLR